MRLRRQQEKLCGTGSATLQLIEGHRKMTLPRNKCKFQIISPDWTISCLLVTLSLDWTASYLRVTLSLDWTVS
jgi:hypothetical protein